MDYCLYYLIQPDNICEFCLMVLAEIITHAVNKVLHLPNSSII